MKERTFVMVKPDGVQRALVGEILAAFERAGLRLIAMKMIVPSAEVARQHYPDTDSWYSIVGEKTLEGYRLIGLDVQEQLGTKDVVAIGKKVKQWLVEFLTSGAVVAMVLEGNNAVRNVRRICGATLPMMADPGTIRGRFGIDSPDAANAEQRPVMNLVHASGEIAEAQFEIQLWFPETASY